MKRGFTLLITLLLLLIGILPIKASSEVPPDSLTSGIGRFNSILSEDVDSDGRDEIIFGSYDGYIVSVEYAGGDYYVDWNSPQMGERAWGLTVGQFDDDPAREIIVGDGEGVVRCFDGVSKRLEWSTKSLGRDAHGLHLYDVDSDGRNELFVGTGFKTDQGWGRIYMFHQGEEEPYDSFPRFDSRLREIYIGDLDSDGEEELIVGSGASLGDIEGSGYLRVFDLQTKELEWISPDLGGCMEGLKVLDLDSDGKLEIVASNGYRYREGYIFVFRYEDGEYRQVWRSDDIGPKVYGLDVGDVDEDGRLEIVAGTLSGYVYIYDAVSHTLEWRSPNLGRDVLGVVIGDPDSDGEVEIIAGQGGYQGKGDYTSGYCTPHVYVIDGKTHRIEAVLGEVDPVKEWVRVGIITALAVAVAEIGVIWRRWGRIKRWYLSG
ncbi:MAG: hypothetical protein DRN42_06025, partial [Thermoplasmata archaeon]